MIQPKWRPEKLSSPSNAERSIKGCSAQINAATKNFMHQLINTQYAPD
jgi:hypothetical protein